MQTLDCGYLTPSRVREYHECPACFFERYVGVEDLQTGRRVTHEPTWGTTHISLVIGNGAHAGAEFGRQHMMEGRKFTMAAAVHHALEAYNQDIAKRKGTIIYENSNVTSLEEGAKEVAALTRAVVTKLLPTERGEDRIVTIERKLNYAGVFDFLFFGRIDAQTANGTIKDLKTSSKDLDAWMRFQLLCYGLPDYCANLASPKLDAIEVDQVKKDNDYRIFRFWEQPTAADYEAARKLVLQTFDAIQILRLNAPRPSYKCKFKHPTVGHEGVELEAVMDFEFLLPVSKPQVPAEMATALDLRDLEAVSSLAVEEEVSLF